jgi:hypothetical protein
MPQIDTITKSARIPLIIIFRPLSVSSPDLKRYIVSPQKNAMSAAESAIGMRSPMMSEIFVRIAWMVCACASIGAKSAIDAAADVADV